MTIKVMAELNALLSASPVHRVSKILVWIDPSPDARMTYKVGRTQLENGEWVDTLALNKHALDKLFVAAGIEEKSSTVDEIEPQKWKAWFEGEWMQPDGNPLPLKKSKTIDMRIGGTRWADIAQREEDFLILKEAEKYEMKKPKKMSYEEFAARVKFQILKNDPDQYDYIHFVAGEIANRRVIQMAKFGAELAESGAANRATRSVMQLGLYTKDQLMNHPFEICRSHFDWEAVERVMGRERYQQMLASHVESSLGVEAPMLPEPVTPLEDGEIEEVVLVPDPFDLPMAGGTAEEIETLFEGRDTKPESSARFLFDKSFANLSDGEAKLLFLAVTEMDEFIGNTEDQDAIDDFALSTQQAVALCAQEKRVPTSLSEVQFVLPGMEDATEDSD
jgi:hypothetical protein